MRETKFTRIMAFVLCLCMLVGSTAVIASAAEAGKDSVTDISLGDIRDLLNAISYGDYAENNKNVPRGDKPISVDIFDYEVDYGKTDASAVEGDALKSFHTDVQQGDDVLFTPQDGSVTFKVNVPERAKYTVEIEYMPYPTGRATSIERVLSINNKVPFAEARYVTLPKYWTNNYVAAYYTPAKDETADSVKQAAVDAGYTAEEITVDGEGRVVIPYKDTYTEAMSRFYQEYGIRFFQADIINNELRPTTKENDRFLTYELKDSSGYYTDCFEFVFEKGESTLTLEGKNEPMYIKSITLNVAEDLPTYEEYSRQYAGEAAGKDTVRIEAEQPFAMSNKTVYAVEDRSCAINSPADVTRTVLNTLGGEKWATAGQWVEYRFTVNNAGMYDIVTRFKQDLLDGMFTCRAMYLYSDGLNEGDKGYYNGSPFEEAQKLMYNYGDSWQVSALSDGIYTGEGKDAKLVTYPVYLEKDVTYTIRFEVTLGKMGDIVRKVEACLESINNDYLNIIKLTGATPDQYRDYYFSTVMPDTMNDMVRQSRALKELALQLEELAGAKSSNVATLEKIYKLLEEMGQDDDEVAKNLSKLKTYIGTLGTFLSDAQTQPLQFDFIQIQPTETEMPAATPGFFEGLIYEVKGFWQSFFRDYDTMGALEETTDEATTVWLALARDQTQVIRSLINNDYTPNSGIAVDLKLVAGGTLLPSILAGSGPDVNLGMAQGEVINYAIRSAILNVEKFDDFEEATKNFNESAMVVLGMEDADATMHYYGLPETQGFPMMYVRLDILSELNLEVPTTWEELMACIPVFQANNMEIGLPTDYRIFLYQNGGELFADGGMRINLDSKVGLESFEKMCNLFTMYSFPYAYDAANRFRTGEMPIIIGDYCGTYNQLKVFATEIEGMWKFVPLPGERQADGTVNNVSISTVTATVMVKGCEEGPAQERAWSFMKWFTGPSAQAEYASEMVAVLGPSAKQATANREALADMPWTTEEYEQVQLQFNNLASVPNYPGAYILDRYTNFAFLSAYVDKEDPSKAMLSYISTINKEIERKRDEFGLEVLTDGDAEYKSLAVKRMAQIVELVDIIKDNKEYKSEYDTLMTAIQGAVRREDPEELMLVAAQVMDVVKQLDPDGSKYKADRTEVMGYDMTDTSLTEAQKQRVRKCYSYEVYKNTSNIVTQLQCCGEFLQDTAECLMQNASN